MSDQFLAEVRAFPFNFAPRGWAMCDGQILAISPNTALFSLLGTFYGGNGTSNFGLPNLQGRISIAQGQLAGGSDYFIGESSGSESVTLLLLEIPNHNHTVDADNKDAADSPSPNNAAIAHNNGVTNMYTTSTSPLVLMNPQAIALTGNSQPHNNMMPYLTMNFCIALQGIYPPRS